MEPPVEFEHIWLDKSKINKNGYDDEFLNIFDIYI